MAWRQGQRYWEDLRARVLAAVDAGMEKIATIGLDLGNNVLQVHAVAAAGRVLVRKQFARC